MFLYFGAHCVYIVSMLCLILNFLCVCIVYMLRLILNFLCLCLILNFLGLCLIFNFFGEKTPELKKKKTYSRILNVARSKPIAVFLKKHLKASL